MTICLNLVEHFSSILLWGCCNEFFAFLKYGFFLIFFLIEWNSYNQIYALNRTIAFFVNWFWTRVSYFSIINPRKLNNKKQTNKNNSFLFVSIKSFTFLQFNLNILAFVLYKKLFFFSSFLSNIKLRKNRVFSI